MHALTKTTVVELKLFLREPTAVFFTLLLPLLLLSLNSSQGNQPDAAFGGVGLVDLLIPGYIAMVMATSGLMALPETIAGYREKGILRRQRATPLPAWTVLTAHAAVHLAIVAAGLVLLIGAGSAFADLNQPAAWPAVAFAILVAAVSVLATGFVLASVLPTTRTTQAVAAALYFPTIFFSGATFPRDTLPEVAQRVGDVLPLTYAIRAIQEPWVGRGTDWAALAILAGVIGASFVICSRTFRWE